jgi:hypothetical protein
MITPPRAAPFAKLLQRVREEYREMPSLRLTPSQATRLFELEPSVCAASWPMSPGGFVTRLFAMQRAEEERKAMERGGA